MKLKDINFFDITKSLALVLVIVFVLFYGKMYVDSTTATNMAMQQQIVQISENAVLSAGNIANNAQVKALEAQFKLENSQIMAKFKEQQKVTGEALIALGQVQAELDATRKLRVASDKIFKKEGQDQKHWYFFKKITVTNKKGEEVPVAWAMFYPYRDADNQWKIGTYEMDLDVKVIETEQEDDSYNIYSEATIKGKGGKELPVENISVDWAKIERKEKSFMWNPRFAMGTTFKYEPGFALNASLFSYGKTKRDMDFRFITPGISLHDQDFSLTIEPFSWNIGNVIPGIENIFVGPFADYDFKTDFGYGLGISIPF